MEEYFSTEQALKHAIDWCAKHPGWKRICDIPDTSNLYKTWDELSKKERNSWETQYGSSSAESAWQEFGIRPCKVRTGYISGKGKFYRNALDIPQFHNLMMLANRKGIAA